MAAELKPYPCYKDSGVEWLGAVPAHWEVRRIGKIFKGGGGTKEDERESGVPCVRYLIRGPACCGGDVIVLRPSVDADARFLGYALDCTATARQKARIGRGFTVVHIYSSDLKYVTVAIPSLLEQGAIVRFLDHADRRIRRYIRAREKLIALLEEQKQAVIHEAVTGQIDVRTGRPYPAYKDSGVEWLGTVPAHWQVRAAKWYFREADDRSATGSEELLSVSHITGVTPRSIIIEDGTKRIVGDLVWKEDEDHSLALEFRSDVESTSGWPLFVKGRYSSAARTLTYALILKTAGRIYALDLGKDHHNPECEHVGEKHKHRWSERDRDKRAYVPDDVKVPASDPVSVWREFCAEARIRREGTMQPPPKRQGELW